MKLRALRLHNVKRFAGRGVAIENIGEGVNVLCAANEVGKSTCFEALHALFFQPHSGTPGSVQMLRPYSGGNPLVQADIETEAGAYRLTKQFYGGRQARVIDLGNDRLVAQADEAERFIADLTRGGSGGPAGLLWVRQGLTGLEKRSKSEEEGDRRIRETLLSSVQGEVEALTGGRRMAEIVATCEEALNRLVTTTLRPKAGSPYAEAIEERERLALLEKQLAADVTTLRDALDRRRAATRRLAEIEAPAEIEARNQAITAAEDAFQAARSHGETLRAAEADLALAVEQHRGAALALEQYLSAFARAEKAERQSATAIQRLQQAKAHHGTALAEIDRLQAARDAAESAERQAREDKDRLDAAQAAREAAERFDAANALLNQAEAIRTRIETGEAILATLQVPELAIQQLEGLDLDLARLQAVQAAALPTLRMNYIQSGDTAVSLAGQPLRHESDKTFSGTVDLDIENIGRLTIRSQHVDDTADAMATVKAKMRMLLAGLGVESVLAARQRQTAAREQSDALTLDRQLLRQVAPDGIEALRQTVTRFDRLRGESLEMKFDAATLVDALRQAEANVVASRNAARQAQPMLASAHQELLDAHAAEAQLQADLRVLDEALGPTGERPGRQARLTNAVKECQERLQVTEGALDPLRLKAQDLAAAEITLSRLRAVAKAADQEIALNKEMLADLNGQIRIQADGAVEEQWQETTDLLAASIERVRRYEREVATLDRLRKALAAARSAARDLYLGPVISELRPLIGLLFDDVTVAFNEETLLPESVRRNGQDEDVERLSGGMREQLSVLTRLAFARLLARDGRPAPVILDDALVYSDDDRIERMFEALHRQSRDQQILVFSCRQRAFSRLGGNVLTMSEWVPS